MHNIAHTKIISYQNDWPEKFQIEKERLHTVFGDTALEIEHIGSTSVSGLSSKSIIDIGVLIKNHEDADNFTKPLAQIGYTYQSDSSSVERHFYLKSDPIEYHLSIAYADQGGFWVRQILFRDYLRNHPEVRDEYARLKIDLLEKDPTGSHQYFEGKSAFVYKILGLAGWKE